MTHLSKNQIEMVTALYYRRNESECTGWLRGMDPRYPHRATVKVLKKHGLARVSDKILVKGGRLVATELGKKVARRYIKSFR